MQEPEPISSGGSRRRKHFALLALVVAAVLLAIWAGYWWSYGRYFENTDDAYVGGDVTVISPRVSGYVAKICVKDNAYVHAGESLAELDPADYNAKRNAADAKVGAASAALTRLNAQVQLTQATIDEAKAKQQASLATLNFARQNAARYSQLSSTQAGTVQDAQQSQADRAQAEAQYKATTSVLVARQSQLAVIQAQIVEARSALTVAQAEATLAKLDTSYTVIRAPIDGYVGNRSAHVGTFVVAGTELMSLVPAHDLWIDANFKEDQVGRMHRGQPVDVVADVESGEKITGHVVSLAPASGSVFSLIPAQNATGNFTKIVQRVPVRIALDGKFASFGLLRPGLSVTATVDTRGKERQP